MKGKRNIKNKLELSIISVFLYVVQLAIQYSFEIFHRMAMVVKRSQLVRQIQEQHAELVELSATLELQQLRTYPTLNVPIYQQDL